LVDVEIHHDVVEGPVRGHVDVEDLRGVLPGRDVEDAAAGEHHRVAGARVRRWSRRASRWLEGGRAALGRPEEDEVAAVVPLGEVGVEGLRAGDPEARVAELLDAQEAQGVGHDDVGEGG
jgi:hypothetical protein